MVALRVEQLWRCHLASKMLVIDGGWNRAEKAMQEEESKTLQRADLLNGLTRDYL